MKVLLVDMPFDNLERPALGLSLIQSRLLEDGVECDILYANAMFAKTISVEAYTAIANRSPHHSLAGEWVFAADLFGCDPERDAEYVRKVLGGVKRDYLTALSDARCFAAGFLDELVASVCWGDCDIVGFTSTGDQNLAAMALARRLKEAFPHLIIVAGGANWHGTMGLAQLRAFPYVDLGFLGEGEQALPAVISALVKGTSVATIPGVALAGRRDADEGAAFVADLEALPPACFDDYYSIMAETGLDGEVSCGVCLEASRGCRWAQRQPCAFCGLSGPVRRYRTKSSVRILRELRGLAARWPGTDIDIVDNMVPPAFLGEVLPELVRRPIGARLFFEARPELTPVDIERIASIGAFLQVGVESLSDHVLGLMGKGTSLSQVLRLLGYCADAGLAPAWNIILGMPGETEDDYREMIELVPSLRELPPPQACALLTLVRFSPLFESHEELGFSNVRPSAAYRLTYRVADDTLWGLAAAFDYDEDPSLRTRAYRYRLRAEVLAWQDGWRPAARPIQVTS